MSGRAEVCQTLEAAIAALANYCLDTDDLVTDAVLVLGAQYFDDDGDRVGRVIVFPRGGSQPAYITKGLLHDARRLINQAQDGGGE